MRNFTTYSFLMLLALATGCQKETPSVATSNIIPNDFLSDKKYDQLVVEIQYVSGNAPTSATLANLQTFLQQRLNKSSGITLTQNAIPAPGKSVYSVDDVQNIENANRTQSATNKTLTAYFFFADGDYASNSGSSKVLGFAYGSSSMAIFEKTIKGLSGGLGQPSVTVLESAVLLHEFGHILGLVNNGTPMQAAHQDVANGKHCDDQNCLMYYSVETSDVVANIAGGNIPALTTSCINDLVGNGGK
jgi:hypothetical protein